MNSFLHLSLLLTIIVTHTKCDLWNQQLPQLLTIVIQPDKSIKLEDNFTELQITGLDGTLHYETLSKLNVSKLKIFNNHITKIENGAICSSPTLQTLHLSFAGNPQAPDLTKNTFLVCNLQLKDLFLRFDFDKPSKIRHDALEELHLRSLGLWSFRIRHLRKNFLKLKTGLTVLMLSNCRVEIIDSDVFDDLVNLEEVEVSYNRKLTSLPDDLFAKTLKLKRLYLQYNRIRELDWRQFEDLSFLEELNLSGNRLAYFDAQQVSRVLPNLKRLEIKKNLVPCKLKKKFGEDLKMIFNSSIKVVFATDFCVD